MTELTASFHPLTAITVTGMVGVVGVAGVAGVAAAGADPNKLSSSQWFGQLHRIPFTR